MQYVEHIEQYGTALFERVCKMDLEGIVAKHSFGNYVTERERTTWFKIKNRDYSQSVGREKLFERERHKEPAPGWHVGSVPSPDVPTVDPQSARIARWNVVDVRSAGSATTSI
jgi:hypothetical protein